METAAATAVPQKQQRKALRKRQYVKYVKFLRKQLRRRNSNTSIEVKSPTRQWEGYLECIGTFDTQGTAMDATQADAFWKNYAIAQEWQNRHNITWWRSRCVVLEQENEVLRNKIRSLARRNQCIKAKRNYENYYPCEMENNKDALEETVDANNQNLELNVTEDMLEFLETSERHRREMQERRKSEGNTRTVRKKETKQESFVVNTPEMIRAKREEAKLLYGDATPKILAMEAALQVAANRYKDLTNAQYWPNIPLKP